MHKLLEALQRFLEQAGHIQKRRALAPIERELEQAMQKAFRRQGRAFMKRFADLGDAFWVEESIGNVDWWALFDDASWETWWLFETPLTAAVRASLVAGAAQATTGLGLGVAFDLANPRAVAYIAQHGAALVTKINDTTKAYIRTVIQNGVDQGWSYDRMAKAISDRFEEFAVGRPQEHVASRAHLVAIQETGQAYEAANFMPAQDLADHGIEMEKSWSTMGDSNVSELCLGNETDGWIPIDQPHSSGHMHPLGHIACRCDELYRRKEA